jgi:hypothetical protein
MLDTIEAVTHYLDLELPYKIILRQKIKGARALYYEMWRKDKLVGHRIEISLEKDLVRDVETLLVHEFIHAWQAENKYRDTHGKSFRRKAADIELIFGIKNLYIPKVDK